jgi:hypothetical protein
MPLFRMTSAYILERMVRKLVLATFAAVALLGPTAMVIPSAQASTAPANAAAGASAQPATGSAPGGNCAAMIKESASHPGKIFSCVTAVSPTATATHAPAPATSAAASLPCVTTRTSWCETGGSVSIVELVDGASVGAATWDYTLVIAMSARSLTRTIQGSAKLVSTTGVTAAAVNSISFISEWGTGSAVLWPVTPMVLDQTLSGTATATAALAPGAVLSLSEGAQFIMCSTSGSPECLTPYDAGGTLQLRCDDEVAVSNSAGCINSGYTPTLTLSSTIYGAGALMIAYAESNLHQHWGSENPLRRLADSGVAGHNRSIICNSTFISGSTGVASDSCDEYPFAATYESGALNGVTSGAQCAQVTAVRTASTGTTAHQWDNIRVISAGDGLCVRGHIPLSLNTGVGSALGTFTIANRLIDTDQYFVTVTT